jgi:CheY-like chemotaxis protein
VFEVHGTGIRETLRDRLELEGFRVNTARNGFEGLQRLQQAMPCLILLDLMMPVVNGWEFLKRLQAEHHRILSARRSCHAAALCWAPSPVPADSGSTTLKTEPLPSSLLTSIRPPCFCTIP